MRSAYPLPSVQLVAAQRGQMVLHQQRSRTRMPRKLRLGE